MKMPEGWERAKASNDLLAHPENKIYEEQDFILMTTKEMAEALNFKDLEKAMTALKKFKEWT